MEIVLKEALIQLMDTAGNTFVTSDGFMSFSDVEKEVLESKIRKILSADKREGMLKGRERYNDDLRNYHFGMLNEFAQKIGQACYHLKNAAEIYENSYLIFVEFVADEREYLLIIDNVLKSCITHQSVFDEGGMVNHLIRNDYVLSKELSKEDSFFLYDYINGDVSCKESEKRKSVFEDGLFEFMCEPTVNEVVKTMEKSVVEVSKRYDIPVDDVMSDFKGALIECDDLEPLSIGRVVFAELPSAKEAFEKEMEHAGLSEKSIPHEEIRLPKKDRTLRFVTDEGIEISIPANYLKRKDKVEIISHSDGTTSIEIKNIAELKNRK